jgi:type IV pilus assembly protein PilB
MLQPVGTKRQLLGKILVDTRLLTAGELEEALVEQRLQGNQERLGTLLLRKGAVTASELVTALAMQRQAVAFVR